MSTPNILTGSIPEAELLSHNFTSTNSVMISTDSRNEEYLTTRATVYQQNGVVMESSTISSTSPIPVPRPSIISPSPNVVSEFDHNMTETTSFSPNTGSSDSTNQNDTRRSYSLATHSVSHSDSSKTQTMTSVAVSTTYGVSTNSTEAASMFDLEPSSHITSHETNSTQSTSGPSSSSSSTTFSDMSSFTWNKGTPPSNSTSSSSYTAGDVFSLSTHGVTSSPGVTSPLGVTSPNPPFKLIVIASGAFIGLVIVLVIIIVVCVCRKRKKPKSPIFDSDYHFGLHSRRFGGAMHSISFAHNSFSDLAPTLNGPTALPHITWDGEGGGDQVMFNNTRTPGGVGNSNNSSNANSLLSRYNLEPCVYNAADADDDEYYKHAENGGHSVIAPIYRGRDSVDRAQAPRPVSVRNSDGLKYSTFRRTPEREIEIARDFDGIAV